MISPILFLLLLFANVWIYGGYFLFIAVLASISRKENEIDPAYTPEATIIIPTFNEERVIEERLRNLLAQDYPRDKLQILVVDSGSTDRTRELVKCFSSYGVELLTENERKGKGAAIKYALNFCRYGIIVTSDANSHFEQSSCLRYLLSHFSDPKVGGATGRYFSRENVKGQGSQGTIWFREHENILRSFESKVDSVVSLFGELFACRKDLYIIDDKSMAEDLDTSIYIRKQGFRLVYEPRSGVYEYAPYLQKELFNQRRSVIIGTIQAICKYKHMLFNPYYRLYGMVIFPGHKLFPILSPFILLSLLLISAVFFKMFLSFCVLLFLGLFLFMVALNLINQKFPNPVNIVFYIILVNFSCLLAWRDYFIGRYSVKWKKMESSRI